MSKTKKQRRRCRTSSRTPVSARERSGRRSRRAVYDCGPTHEIIRHRKALVGADEVLNPRSGYPLGVLLLSGGISEQQHDAGVKFRALDARYHFSRGLPHRHPKTITGGGLPGSTETSCDTDPEQWEKLRLRYAVLLTRMIQKAGYRAHSSVVDIVLFDQWSSPYTLNDLRAGLDVLADYFNGGK